MGPGVYWPRSEHNKLRPISKILYDFSTYYFRDRPPPSYLLVMIRKPANRASRKIITARSFSRRSHTIPRGRYCFAAFRFYCRRFLFLCIFPILSCKSRIYRGILRTATLARLSGRVFFFFVENHASPPPNRNQWSEYENLTLWSLGVTKRKMYTRTIIVYVFFYSPPLLDHCKHFLVN